MPVSHTFTPGVTGDWQPTNGAPTRCHCGNPAVVLGLCRGHLQTAVVAAGVVRRAARMLLDVIAQADTGHYNLASASDVAVFVSALRGAARRLDDCCDPTHGQ